jgi:hypothetical protein
MELYFINIYVHCNYYSIHFSPASGQLGDGDEQGHQKLQILSKAMATDEIGDLNLTAG